MTRSQEAAEAAVAMSAHAERKSMTAEPECERPWKTYITNVDHILIMCECTWRPVDLTVLHMRGASYVGGRREDHVQKERL